MARADARTEVMDRRERLIESAIELFSTRPFDEVSVQDIAAAADVATGLLYYHFTDKQGLYAAALQTLADRAKAAVGEATDPAAKPLARLRAALEAQLGVFAKNQSAYRELLGGGSSQPRVREILERERSAWLELAAECVPERVRRDPTVAATLEGWLRFAEGIQLAWLAGREIPLEEVAELCVRVLESSVRTAERLNGKASKS